MTSTCTSTTHTIPIRCRVGSLCCFAKSIEIDSDSQTRSLSRPLFDDELFAADDSDLGEPESLRRSHDTGDDIVLGVLVRPKVQFRLHRFRGCGLELLFERLSVCNHFAIPVNSAARVDID